MYSINLLYFRLMSSSSFMSERNHALASPYSKLRVINHLNCDGISYEPGQPKFRNGEDHVLLWNKLYYSGINYNYTFATME